MCVNSYWVVACCLIAFSRTVWLSSLTSLTRRWELSRSQSAALSRIKWSEPHSFMRPSYCSLICSNLARPESQAYTHCLEDQAAPSKNLSRSVSPSWILCLILASCCFRSAFSASRFRFSICILFVYLTAVSTSFKPVFGPSLSCLITATFSLSA